MDIKITKREILFSVVIVIVLLCVGFLISNNIDSALLDSFQDYDNALKIDNDKDMFEYGMRTSVGKAFIYGEVKAIDTVSYPDIDGDYSFIRKDTERYTKHYRTVTKTRKNSKGETERYTEEEEYYTWDLIRSESTHSSKVAFLEVEFNYDTIPHIPDKYIDTLYKGSSWFHWEGDLRDVYHGSPISGDGTAYAELTDGTMKVSDFNYYSSIDETIKMKESKWQLVVFWIFWVLLIIGAVIGFYFIDNRWLEDALG